MSVPPAVAPPDEIAAFLVDAASKTPSVHDTQPKWFGVRGSPVSLHADPERRPDVADPDVADPDGRGTHGHLLRHPGRSRGLREAARR